MGAAVAAPDAAVAADVEELRLEPVGGFDELRPEWEGLAERSGSVFATPEWNETWWRHFGDGGHVLQLLAARDRRGRVVAIVPLYRHRRLPIMRFVGHGPADRLGPICAPADLPAAARAVAIWARGTRRPTLLLAEQLPSGPEWRCLDGARLASVEGNPVLDFGAVRTWADLIASWPAGVDRKTRRSTRRLEREMRVAHRTTSAPEELPGDLDVLVDLHRARWGRTPTAFAGPHWAFHREFAAIALSRGWLQLSFLELDGRPAAAVYNLRYGGADHQYQLGRDPRWDHRSVGHLALTASIRRALEAGQREFRFGRGDEAYKYRFANADRHLQTVLLSPGRVLAGLVGLGLALPGSATRTLRRRLIG